jgi:hypothetical protein
VLRGLDVARREPERLDLCGNQTVNAIEQTPEWRQPRVDGVGRPKFDFHTGLDELGVLGGALPGRCRALSNGSSNFSSMSSGPSTALQTTTQAPHTARRRSTCVEINQCVGCTDNSSLR